VGRWGYSSNGRVFFLPACTVPGIQLQHYKKGEKRETKIIKKGFAIGDG
jgi:hypothetical protein